MQVSERERDAEGHGDAAPGSRLQLLRERERLFSEAAHEFRTPLAIIGCNAELIGEGMIDGDEARQAARVIMDTVHETDVKLSQLLENARFRLDHDALDG